MLQQTELATPVRRHLLVSALQHRQLLHARLLRQMAVRRGARSHSYGRTLLRDLVTPPLILTVSSAGLSCRQALVFGLLPGWRWATTSMLRKTLTGSSSALSLAMLVLALCAMRILRAAKFSSRIWDGH